MYRNWNPCAFLGEYRIMQPLENNLVVPQKVKQGGFPGGAAVKNPPANSGDTGSIPGLGRSQMPWSN